MARINSVIGRPSSGATVQMAPPAATDRSSSQAWGQFQSGLGDVTRGRVSLLMLDSLILLLVAFPGTANDCFDPVTTAPISPRPGNGLADGSKI